MPCGSIASQRIFLVFATVSDFGDGLMRLVADVERFGLTLLSVNTGQSSAMRSTIRLAIQGECTFDCGVLVSRLKRRVSRVPPVQTALRNCTSDWRWALRVRRSGR